MSTRYITQSMMLGFESELLKESFDKEALIRELLSRVGKRGLHAAGAGLGSGMSLGALAGAGLGAGVQGVRQYRYAREHGAGVGQSLGYGAAGSLRGGMSGALVGAAAGGLGGAALGAASPDKVLKVTQGLAKKDNFLGGVARAGQRQVHGFTGWTPEAGVGSIRAGSYGAKEQATQAAKHLADVREGKAAPGLATKLRAKLQGKDAKDLLEQKAQKGVARSQKAVAASQKAEDMGLTSLPGIARSMKNNGVARTIRAGMSDQWHAGGAGTKALMVGFPAASAVGAAVSPTQPGGPGKGERIGQALGTVGYTAAPLTMGASMALGEGLSRAGGEIGKGVDYLLAKGKKHPTVPARARRAPQEEVENETAQAVPSERIYGTGVTGHSLGE